ncbi:DNA breaking-rejoining enzyme [Trametes polyzona]|nr:DNA breaking-rejoining enzyme [Trametes polyzona]
MRPHRSEKTPSKREQPKSTLQSVGRPQRSLRGAGTTTTNSSQSSSTGRRATTQPHRQRFNAPIPERACGSRRGPTAYKEGLVPRPSILRPHCLASERLVAWAPPRSTRNREAPGTPRVVSDEDLERIKAVTSRAWTDSTLQTYSTGLLTYHVFCDMKGIPEADRAPASEDLVLSFIAALAGSYSASAIENYIAGLKAVKAALSGAGQLAPATSKRSKREPITLQTLEQIKGALDISKALDAAVWACACVAFFSLARLGELTVRNQKAFQADAHPTRDSIREEEHRDGSQVTVIRVPRTKTSPEGEDISFARSSHCADAQAALENHLKVNALRTSCHLFAYRKQPSNAIVPLTKAAMMKRLQGAAASVGVGNISGHSFRIGGTLEYLLKGVSFEAVKAIGRWKSDAFTLYLRKHAQILAPYMQDNAELIKALSQVAIQIPPVR